MKLPDLNTVPKIANSKPKRDSLDAMTLLVIQTTDGTNSIGDISDATGLEPTLAQKIVLNLITRNILHIEGFTPDSDGRVPEDTRPSAVPAAKSQSEVDRLCNLPQDTLLYELFDISADASRKEIRDRYFQLSKRFHPDRAGSQRDPEQKHKYEMLFGRLTQAYDVLSSPKSRAEYDDKVSDKLELWTIGRKLKSAVSEKKEAVRSSSPPDMAAKKGPVRSSTAKAAAKEPSGAVRAVSKPAAKPPSSPPKPKQRPSRPDLDERRRKLKQARAGKAMKNLLSRVSAAPPSARNSAEPRNATSPLVSNVPADSSMEAELIKKAGLAVEQAEFEQALNYLKAVPAEHSNNPQVGELIAKAQAGADRARSHKLLNRGRQAQRTGNSSEAKTLFEQAIRIDPTSMDARHLLADLLLQTRTDLPRALTMATDVIRKGGQHARYFATLGELLLLNKQHGEARSVLEQALKKAPGNDRYKKLLRACKN